MVIVSFLLSNDSPNLPLKHLQLWCDSRWLCFFFSTWSWLSTGASISSPRRSMVWCPWLCSQSHRCQQCNQLTGELLQILKATGNVSFKASFGGWGFFGISPWPVFCWRQLVTDGLLESVSRGQQWLDSSHRVCLSSPWYNRTGWLGVKHQLTYLLCLFGGDPVCWGNVKPQEPTNLLTSSVVSLLLTVICGRSFCGQSWQLVTSVSDRYCIALLSDRFLL